MSPGAVAAGLVVGALLFSTLARGPGRRTRLTWAVVAIAAFYPAFAIAEGDWAALGRHLGLFVIFVALAAWGSRAGLVVLGGALVAHGLIDLALLRADPPGPGWWPAFCASVDLLFGAAVLARSRVTA
ncbi:hypothetical protein [Wenxinia marina]|uniref:Uncharacterized protein n=1 Tax=Wenxinia marina DSM 24838 TaxID=1123501 RepID=A0A0D0Q795_9RHOB|nr:hypothetical protein [Wenxinia marina]KIQ70299.1 hypothetical protein Wenmar_00674 [Wenxinia marina DSM 24838]GGL54193.1 hypothetical protein GCM10011392_05770 [Wenxinia marina]